MASLMKSNHLFNRTCAESRAVRLIPSKGAGCRIKDSRGGFLSAWHVAVATYPQSCVLIRRVTKRPRARSSHHAPIRRCSHEMGTIGKTVSSVSAPCGAIPAASAPTRCARTVGTSMQNGTNFRRALPASFRRFGKRLRPGLRHIVRHFSPGLRRLSKCGG